MKTMKSLIVQIQSWMNKQQHANHDHLQEDTPVLSMGCNQAIKRNKKFRGQGGFTLLELVIVLGIIALLAGLISSKFDGSNSKATRLIADMKTISASFNRAAFDLGGYPSNMTVLWLQSAATSSNMFNGITATSSWAGPYLDTQPVDSNNNVLENDVNDSAIIGIAREAANPSTNGGNYTWVYYLHASNIPNAVISAAIQQCSHQTVVSSATFVNGTCRASLGTGGTETGTLDVKVADSR